MNPATSDWAVPQKAATALNRYGTVDETAALVSFVAGPDSSYMTGTSLHPRWRHGRLFTKRPNVFTLAGKTALVTGASRGTGGATATALARAGAYVLAHYGKSVEEAESLVAEIRANGGRADSLSADLAAPEGSARLAHQVRSFVSGRLDVLVLNAGISKAASLAAYSVEDLDNLFATNVRGPFFVVQHLVPLLGDGPNIIVISSVVARTVVGKPGLENPSILAYASTKGTARDISQELDSNAPTAGHTRQRSGAGRDRYGHVQLH